MIGRKAGLRFIALASLALSAATQRVPGPKGVLDPENALEARLSWLQPPDRVMDAIGLLPGMAIADIGAGRGRYTVQFAVRVGEKGKVYAEDIDAAALDYLKRRCQRWGLGNVEAIHGDPTDPKLPPGRLDLIFVISAYHHFSDPIALMRHARPALKADGRLAIGEWIPTSEGRGEGTPPATVTAQMNAAGFVLERIDQVIEANGMNIYIFRPGTKK